MKYTVSLFLSFSLLSGAEWMHHEATTFAKAEIGMQAKLETHPPDIQKALDYVEQSEYFIHYQDNVNALQSPNRAQNMRFTYKPDGFEVKPRVDSTTQWNIAFTLQGIFRGNQQILGATDKATEKLTDNHLIYLQNGYEIEYLNGKDGMRQNFIIAVKPVGSEPLMVKMLVKAENLSIECSENELSGTQCGITQYYYKDLKVFDANGQAIEATMDMLGEEFSLVVSDQNATYPLTIDPQSTTAAAILESNQADSYFGESVAGAGDVNGDGYSDVIVAADWYDNGQINEGAVFVYHGSANGISTTAAAMLESNQERAYMGGSIASAGDVNSDGYSDVIVGVSFFENGQAGEGAAFVYYGGPRGINTHVPLVIEGNKRYSSMGTDVAGAGDVNGDGFSDVITSNQDTAFVFQGSAGGVITTNTIGKITIPPTEYGADVSAVSSAGDVNGDGYSDVIVGSMDYENGQDFEGAAFVYHGSITGISNTAATVLEGNQEFSLFGYGGLACAGDVNGDGYSDVIVGAVYYYNVQDVEGAAFVYHGSASGIYTKAAAKLESNQASANFGWSVSSAGDVNGDGYSDVIVGVESYDNGQTNEGAAFIYYGSASGISTTADAMVESNREFSGMGSAVACAGDVNGDGFSDVIVGASYYSNGQDDEGAAFVYHGGGVNYTNKWLGITTDWNCPSNWSLGVVPSAAMKAVVNTNVPNMPSISGVNNTCYTLTLSNGATLNIAPGARLIIKGK
jgi:FG-GAP-like repeat/FG-GAP repeat